MIHINFGRLTYEIKKNRLVIADRVRNERIPIGSPLSSGKRHKAGNRPPLTPAVHLENTAIYGLLRGTCRFGVVQKKNKIFTLVSCMTVACLVSSAASRPPGCTAGPLAGRMTIRKRVRRVGRTDSIGWWLCRYVHIACASYM